MPRYSLHYARIWLREGWREKINTSVCTGGLHDEIQNGSLASTSRAREPCRRSNEATSGSCLHWASHIRDRNSIEFMQTCLPCWKPDRDVASECCAQRDLFLDRYAENESTSANL